MTTYAKCLCDFCKRENPEYLKLLLPVITDCKQEEGKKIKSKIKLEQHDICEECLIKAADIHSGWVPRV